MFTSMIGWWIYLLNYNHNPFDGKLNIIKYASNSGQMSDKCIILFRLNSPLCNHTWKWNAFPENCHSLSSFQVSICLLGQEWVLYYKMLPFDFIARNGLDKSRGYLLYRRVFISYIISHTCLPVKCNDAAAAAAADDDDDDLNDEDDLPTWAG